MFIVLQNLIGKTTVMKRILKQERHTYTHTHTLGAAVCLVVGHVTRCGAELGVGLDDLVHGLQEVLLCGDLPASPDGKHAGLCAHTADLRA